MKARNSAGITISLLNERPDSSSSSRPSSPTAQQQQQPQPPPPPPQQQQQQQQQQQPPNGSPPDNPDDPAPASHQQQPPAAMPRKNLYPCPLAREFNCPNHFTTSGHAARHAKKHTGRKDAVCPDCGKRFTRKDNMEQHRRTHRSILLPVHADGHHLQQPQQQPQMSNMAVQQPPPPPPPPAAPSHYPVHEPGFRPPLPHLAGGNSDGRPPQRPLQPQTGPVTYHQYPLHTPQPQPQQQHQHHQQLYQNIPPSALPPISTFPAGTRHRHPAVATTAGQQSSNSTSPVLSTDKSSPLSSDSAVSAGSSSHHHHLHQYQNQYQHHHSHSHNLNHHPVSVSATMSYPSSSSSSSSSALHQYRPVHQYGPPQQQQQQQHAGWQPQQLPFSQGLPQQQSPFSPSFSPLSSLGHAHDRSGSQFQPQSQSQPAYPLALPGQRPGPGPSQTQARHWPPGPAR